MYKRRSYMERRLLLLNYDFQYLFFNHFSFTQYIFCIPIIS